MYFFMKLFSVVGIHPAEVNCARLELKRRTDSSIVRKMVEYVWMVVGGLYIIWVIVASLQSFFYDNLDMVIILIQVFNLIFLIYTWLANYWLRFNCLAEDLVILNSLSEYAFGNYSNIYFLVNLKIMDAIFCLQSTTTRAVGESIAFLNG